MLPKKLLEQIDSQCRAFVWSSELGSKKSPVAWERVCQPKYVGCLGLRNLAQWNKAALLNNVWNIEKDKSRLWIL